MKLGFERGALADLNEIFAYIAQNNPEDAPKLVARIEKAAARIAETHTLARRQTSQGSGVFPSAILIVYEVGTDQVIIHYVRHGARRRPWEGE